MRATIKKISDQTVSLTQDGDCPITYEPARITRKLTIPLGGGYVRDEHGNQVCELLGNRGRTLIADDGDDLLSLIRKESQKARRADFEGDRA